MAIVRDVDGNRVEIPEDEAERERAQLGGLAVIVGLSAGVILGVLRSVFNLPIDWLLVGFFD